MFNSISINYQSSDPGVTTYNLLGDENRDEESIDENDFPIELLNPIDTSISNLLFIAPIEKLYETKFPKRFETLNFSSEKRIGAGSFKEVYLATMEKPRDKKVIILRSKNGNLSIQRRSHDVETLVARILIKDQDKAKKYFPKVYSVSSSQIIVKYANCGEAKNELPKLPNSQIRDVVSQIGKALIYLQSQGITHNDVALRNILLHQSKDGSPLKAYLTDNGCCVFKDEEVKSDLPRPMDISAPECRSKSNESTDAFSFGQLIADAFLRPGADTNTSPLENQTYNANAIIRWQKRCTTFNLYKKDMPKMANLSAIDSEDYQGLLKIDVDLANLVKSLMSYGPNNRPTLNKAVAILDSSLGMNS